jgi:hypothetical protein
MNFKTFEEAQAVLMKYRPLEGMYYEPAKQQVWRVFVGISDIHMAQAIYSGLRGILPSHPFNYVDLQNIEYYAGFPDGSVVNIDEFLIDPYIFELCNRDDMKEVVTVKEDWSDPLRIPKGLSVRLNFIEESHLEYRIFDLDAPDKFKSSSLERPGNHYMFFKFSEPQYGLAALNKPAISFRLADKNDNPLEIALEFVNE